MAIYIGAGGGSKFKGKPTPPEPKYPLPKQPTGGGGGYTLEEAYNLIMGMLPKYEQPKVDVLSWGEAEGIARKRLDPLYQEYKDQARDITVEKLMQSGYYGQLPGDKKILESMDKAEAQRIAAIGDMAESLYRSSRSDATSIADRAFSQYQQNVQNVLNALGMAQNISAQRYRGDAVQPSTSENPFLNMLIGAAGTGSYGDTFNAIASTLASTYGMPEEYMVDALSRAVQAPNYDLANWMLTSLLYGLENAPGWWRTE